MDAVLDLFRVLFEPQAVFERIRERPRWVEPLLGVLALYAVIVIVMLPFTRVATEAAIQQAMQQRGAPADQAPNAGTFVAIGAVVGLIFFALILLVGATILWINTSLFAGEARFKLLFSVTVYTAIVFVLQQVVSLAVIMAKGKGAITSPDDLQPALGLDLLFPDAKGFVGGLLKGINPFAIFGYWLTGIGVSVTHKTSKGTGMTIAFVTFGVILVITAGLYALRPGH
jgi:hypothetical protein